MKKDKNKNECTINYVHLFCFNSWWKFIKGVATSSLYDIFFLRSTNGKKFWDFDRQCVLVILKKCRRLHSWDPSPPHVCKRLQLGTPSPPKKYGRPIWTAPYVVLMGRLRSDSSVVTATWPLKQFYFMSPSGPLLRATCNMHPVPCIWFLPWKKTNLQS